MRGAPGQPAQSYRLGAEEEQVPVGKWGSGWNSAEGAGGFHGVFE